MSKKFTYPDAYLELLDDGRWKLVPANGPSSTHETQSEAYEALKDLRERNCGGDEGCLMCGS